MCNKIEHTAVDDILVICICSSITIDTSTGNGLGDTFADDKSNTPRISNVENSDSKGHFICSLIIFPSLYLSFPFSTYGLFRAYFAVFIHPTIPYIINNPSHPLFLLAPPHIKLFCYSSIMFGLSRFEDRESDRRSPRSKGQGRKGPEQLQ